MAHSIPINSEAIRRHMKSFEPIVVEDADHFLMVNKSEPFNEALMNAIKAIEAKGK